MTRLHVYYWCNVCGEHRTNYYAPDLWQLHQEDLELAQLDILTCPLCEKRLGEPDVKLTCPECGRDLIGLPSGFRCEHCKLDWSDDEIMPERERSEKPKSVQNVPWRDPKKPDQPKLF